MGELGGECPKCGHNRWRGPTFVEGILNEDGKESLMFTCERCGYHRHEMTKEQKKARQEMFT